ncbi:hypothetical protein HELRODRAFT_188993 [Helobdella robusta]|uniref:J domain-containing protein n=1 Tax=Helobdella robusta TaxID=6412 RepID=T1FQJ4_HELRO|nr:hypothetical protein HELRODRAFT_188993 [Helobdella robusta]ESN99078.1 hypothetical protein HELRODRAFT_188993 [Helobdella robusta]
MAGMQFEYDEEDEQRKKYQCHCEPCQAKRQHAESHEPKKKFQKFIIKLILIIGWIFFIYIAYKTSQVELEFKEFDPYAELEIERGATVADIKKAYRRLSLIYHPDRETGDSHKFMKITKAHDALTDDEARKNWEEYGNPDGPGATQVGIALPKWIVEKQNSIWVNLKIIVLLINIIKNSLTCFLC